MGDVIQNPNQMMMPNVWDGSAKNMLPYPSVTITCTTAPSSARAILGGPNADIQQPRAALYDPGTGATPTLVNTISGTGSYSLMVGNEWNSLAAGAGDGVFYISGGQ